MTIDLWDLSMLGGAQRFAGGVERDPLAGLLPTAYTPR